MSEVRYGGDEPPFVNTADRAAILEGHAKLEVGRFHNDQGTVIEARLLEPVCGRCGGLWGEQGCATVRAMTALAWHEQVGQRWRVRERTLEALAAREYVGLELSAPKREITITAILDAAAVKIGGMELVEASLNDMRRRVAVELFGGQMAGRMAVFR